VIVNNVERKVTNQVTVGKKTQTEAIVPAIGNQIQQPVNQLMLQQLQVLNINVVIVIETITLKTDDSKRRKI
jgi:hypothetical protein